MKMRQSFEKAGLFYVVVILFTSLIAACSLLTGTSRPTICFVLPDGYVGAFQLVLDEKTGIEINEKDGKYIYEIPSSGSLNVKTFRPLDTPSKYVAMYKDGSIIPTDDLRHPDIVSLRVLGTSQHNDGPFVITLVIGTEKQAIQAKIDEMAGELRLGKQ
jgi:hypothetical protein